MRDYLIMTDSCCDLDAELAAQLDLTVLPLNLQMGGETYRNFLDERELSLKEFYARVRNGERATTSAPSAGAFEDAMRQAAAAEKDV